VDIEPSDNDGRSSSDSLGEDRGLRASQLDGIDLFE
jgi:hypothetical protein